MKIVSAASAYPKNYYPQEVLASAFQLHWAGRLENPQMVERLHARVCVDGRFLAMPIEGYLALETWGQANNAWMKTAEELGQSAMCTAIARAGLHARDLDALIFVSITGVSSPSIDARMVNLLHLSPNIRRMPIFGLGCVGGAAGLARAADYVRGHPTHVAALLSVEICSLTLQKDDLSVANLISSGLFGDGCVSVLVAGKDCDLPGIEIVDSKSIFYPNTEDVMGWDISEKGFRIVLSPRVPEVIAEHLGEDVDTFLAEHSLKRSDIGRWLVHTGGPKVLEAARDALGLKDEDVAASWDCLRKTGNLSSASVLAVLEEVMMNRRPEPGTLSVLAAMGPGFCAELLLLRW